ncbi:beta-lactamase family protein [Undibacterium sp. LX15W]|uniref:Beta-lactamase family protein n=2 Tax=Undibacterium flavidum TaxID=2762297 RepID=A0ABR6Y7X2_9BURK|nr:beta-lactamase family protein [Undibacterium flavidum]
MAFVAAVQTAQVAHADQLDDKILREMQKQRIPGLSLAVVQNGKIVREQGYGFANLEHQVKVTPATIFQSGSVGKQFTAALILLLEQDGKLSLNDPISKHLSNTPEIWSGITIRHLLTHTSGLDDPYKNLDFRKDYTDQEWIDLEGKIPMLFQPGEKWLYSNMGYHLLGFICNKVGGKFYGDQLRERIFQPLGMESRIINERDIIMHRAAGYDLVKQEWKNQEWTSPSLNSTADGSLYLTARDLAKWDIALYKDFPLTKQQKEASWTEVKLKDGSQAPYGYGWFLSAINGHKNIEHGGAWQGFTTQINRFVDDKLSVIVLTNRSGSNPKKIADMVAAEYVAALKIEPAKAIQDQHPATTKKLSDMLTAIINGSISENLFTEKFVKARFSERMKALSAEFQRHGAFEKMELLEAKQAQTQQLSYRIRFKGEIFLMSVELDQDGKIDLLRFRVE